MINPLLVLGLMLIATSCASTQYAKNVEVVNDKMVILKDVEKIAVLTPNPDKITYVYDLNTSRLIKVAQGSFDIRVNKGQYLIQSDSKIAKAFYEAEYANER